MIDDLSFKLSGEDFHHFLDLTPDGMLIQRRGIILFVNPAFAEMMRAPSASRFTGRRLLDIIAPEDHPMILAQQRDPNPRARRLPYDVRVIREDGTRAIFQAGGMRVGDRENPVSVMTIRDVTAERAAVEANRRANEERVLIFEEGPIGVAQTDTEGRYIQVNAALCEMLGYAPDELRGMTELDLTHPEDRRLELKALRSLWTGTKHASVRKRMIAKSGATVEVSARVSLMRDQHGAPRGYISHALDVTAELKSAEVLRAAELQFRMLFTQAQIPMVLATVGDGKNHVVQANPAMCTMLGYPEAELVGKSLSPFTHPDERDTDIGRLPIGELQPGEQLQTLKRYRHREGHWITVERLITAIGSGDGAIGGSDGKVRSVVAQFVDLTSRRAAEQQLAERESMHRQLLQNLPGLGVFIFDHELRYTRVEGDLVMKQVGLRPSDLVGRCVLEASDPRELPMTEDRYRRALSGEHVRWEQEMNGHHYDCRASPMLDEKGTIAFGMVVAYEVTALVELRRQLGQLCAPNGPALAEVKASAG